MRQHLPSVIGWAIGFCAAGCGVGALAGGWAGHFVSPEPLDGRGTPQELLSARYGGVCWGMPAGMLLGTLAGVGYAVRARRARRMR